MGVQILQVTRSGILATLSVAVATIDPALGPVGGGLNSDNQCFIDNKSGFNDNKEAFLNTTWLLPNMMSGFKVTYGNYA